MGGGDLELKVLTIVSLADVGHKKIFLHRRAVSSDLRLRSVTHIIIKATIYFS